MQRTLIIVVILVVAGAAGLLWFFSSSEELSANHGPIRLLDDSSIVFQLESFLQPAHYRENQPLQNIESLTSEYILAQVPADSIAVHQPARLEKTMVITIGGAEIPFSETDRELRAAETGWSFQNVRFPNLFKEIEVGKSDTIQFSATLGVEPVYLELTPAESHPDFLLSFGNTVVATQEDIKHHKIRIPPRHVSPGKNEFTVTNTGNATLSLLRWNIGHYRTLVIKHPEAANGGSINISYPAYRKAQREYLSEILHGDYLRKEGFPAESPLFKAQLDDLERLYSTARRSFVMFAGDRFTHDTVLPAGQPRLEFSFGYPRGTQAEGSSLNVMISDKNNPEEKRLFSNLLSGVTGRDVWYDVELPFEQFAGKEISLSFSYESPVSASEADFALFIGEPMILADRTDSEKERPKNVVLISLDTARGDRFSGLGWQRETTPYFDSLLASGSAFTDAVSLTSWTLPSHKTILTGFHHVFLNYLTGKQIERSPLAVHVPSLASYFKSSGYQTAAFTDAGYVTAKYGFERDFDSFTEARFSFGYGVVSGGEERWAKKLNWERAAAWFEKNHSDTPCFLFLHTYNPHIPYSTLGYEHLWQYDEAQKDWPKDLRNEVKGKPGEKYVEHISRIYDRNLRRSDDQLSDFLTILSNKGLLEDTILIITSDHGEQLGEHERIARHGELWESVIRVPLVIIDPQNPGGNSTAHAVSLLNIVPTILDAAGMDIPSYLPGKSLLQPVRENEVTLLSFNLNNAFMLALRDGDYKYLITKNKHQLFDLKADPLEQQTLDLTDGQFRDRAAQMHYQLLQRYADEIPGWNVLLSNPDKETLRIRLSEAAPGSIYSEKAESYKAEGLTISMNNLETESNSEHILFLFEPVEEDDFTLLIEVWNQEAGQWQPYQGAFIGPGDYRADNGSILLNAEIASVEVEVSTLLSLLSEGESLFWYTHKPFTRRGVAGEARLDQQDIEALRNLGYLQ